MAGVRECDAPNGVGAFFAGFGFEWGRCTHVRLILTSSSVLTMVAVCVFLVENFVASKS